MTGDFGTLGSAILYGAGAFALIGLRSWHHRQVTGHLGFSRGSAGDGWAPRISGCGFVFAIVAGIASPILARLHLVPIVWRSESWTAGAAVWFGLGLTLVGFTVGVGAQNAMGPSWRIGVDPSERTELVTDEIYAIVRNPIFSAMIIAQAGTAVMAPTWLSIAGVAILLMAVQVQVRLVEEPHLLKAHGPAYASYASTTGRFVPVIGALDAPTDSDVRDVERPMKPRSTS